MYCVKCGVHLADSEKKCPICGTRVYHPDLPEPHGEPTFPNPGTEEFHPTAHGVPLMLTIFTVLAAVHFLGRVPLPKALAAVFCGFGLAFAALAGAKLVTYMDLYGLTPRRVVAGWFLGVLTVWAVLVLVRVFRRIPVAHIAILVLAVSFAVLSCVNMKQRIIDANLARVEAGVDAEPDWGVLWECGYEEN